MGRNGWFSLIRDKGICRDILLISTTGPRSCDIRLSKKIANLFDKRIQVMWNKGFHTRLLWKVKAESFAFDKIFLHFTTHKIRYMQNHLQKKRVMTKFLNCFWKIYWIKKIVNFLCLELLKHDQNSLKMLIDSFGWCWACFELEISI